MADRSGHPYRIVAVSLYTAQANDADRCTEALKRAGWPKANRSLVIREALRLLQEALAGKDDERVFRYFVERYARRVGSAGTNPRRDEFAPLSSPGASPNAPASRGTVSEAP